METHVQTLGEFIRSRREQLALTQEYVSRRLEISERQYRKWETGVARPTIENLALLLRVLHLRYQDVEEILLSSHSSN